MKNQKETNEIFNEKQEIPGVTCIQDGGGDKEWIYRIDVNVDDGEPDWPEDARRYKKDSTSFVAEVSEAVCQTKTTKVEKDFGVKPEKNPRQNRANRIKEWNLKPLAKNLRTRDGKKVNVKQVYSALIAAEGNIFEAYRILNVDNFVDFQECFVDNNDLTRLTKFFQDKLVNKAQDVILKLLEQEEDKSLRFQAAKFVLKTLGRQIGYGDSSTNILVDMSGKKTDDKKEKIMSIFQIQTDEDGDETRTNIQVQIKPEEKTEEQIDYIDVECEEKK